MTDKLSQLLNLHPAPDAQPPTIDESQQFIDTNQAVIADVDSAISKIDEALPLVKDLETSDDELDSLAKLATEKFQDMIDLGMNTDPRFAGVILQTASALLGHAITAKTAKIDKKLKVVQLQLQKARLDHQISKESSEEGPAIDGKGIVLDRNALLAQILASSQNKKKE